MNLLKLKTKLAVFNRATMPKSTSVVPKQTKTPVGGTNFPELSDIEINPNDGRQIADAYDALEHNPNDPKVKESYDALINETKQQFDELQKGGLKIDPIIDNSNAYKNSDEMHLDLEKNKHINFFPTEEGFGSTDEIPKDHPMLQPSGIKIGDKELLNNDVFRIVHDVNGHFRGQASGFGPKGEQQAFLTHAQMFSDKARRALFTETAGQNNWVNFNRKFGDKNRADPKNTVFAEQKAGLLPDEIVFNKWHTPKKKLGKQKIAVKFLSSFGPDLDAIEAFKKGQDYQGYVGKGKNKRLKFEVANGGTELKLHGHTIAKKTKNGIAVSNAGFDTGLTYSSLKELGVNAKRLPNGKVQLHNKELDAVSGKFITVPLNEISKTPIRATKSTPKRNSNRTVTEQSAFREKVLNRELKEQNRKQLPLSSTTIQPKDQRIINKITGIKSRLPRKSIATDAHHIFPVHKFPGLRNNPNNGIFQTRREHKELEDLNPDFLRAKLARIKNKNIDKLIGIGDKTGIEGSRFLTRDGTFSEEGGTHEDIISQFRKHVGMNPNTDESDTGSEFMDKTGSIRTMIDLNGKRVYKPTINIEVRQEPTTAQVRRIRDIIKNSNVPPENIILNDDRIDWKRFERQIGIRPFRSAGIEPLVRKKKQVTPIKKKGVKNAMIQTAKMLSADAIMDKFGTFRREHPESLGSGVFDPVENRILDARIPLDAIRLQRFFESGTNKIGFNSITDTRQGPESDVNLIRSQLKEIEQSGGIPALGFDEGSLEALNVITRTTDAEILADLRENQRSTGILDGDLTFRIVDNQKFRPN